VETIGTLVSSSSFNIDDKVFEMSVNLQFSQKTHVKSPTTAADHLFTNIRSYVNHHVLR